MRGLQICAHNISKVLESDPEFRKKLETAKVEEIRDGTIAKELEFLRCTSCSSSNSFNSSATVSGPSLTR